MLPAGVCPAHPRRGTKGASCAAFRRELWERRPWHTHNDWVDSTFWVGLAHLGARFAGSDRPQFLYQDHPDSTSHRLTHIDRLLAARSPGRMCPVDTDVTICPQLNRS